jgi:hypothetical protein
VAPTLLVRQSMRESMTEEHSSQLVTHFREGAESNVCLGSHAGSATVVAKVLETPAKGSRFYDATAEMGQQEGPNEEEEEEEEGEESLRGAAGFPISRLLASTASSTRDDEVALIATDAQVLGATGEVGTDALDGKDESTTASADASDRTAAPGIGLSPRLSPLKGPTDAGQADAAAAAAAAAAVEKAPSLEAFEEALLEPAESPSRKRKRPKTYAGPEKKMAAKKSCRGREQKANEQPDPKDDNEPRKRAAQGTTPIPSVESKDAESLASKTPAKSKKGMPPASASAKKGATGNGADKAAPLKKKKKKAPPATSAGARPTKRARVTIVDDDEEDDDEGNNHDVGEQEEVASTTSKKSKRKGSSISVSPVPPSAPAAAAAAAAAAGDGYQGAPPRIAFTSSTVPQQPKLLNGLLKLGAKMVDAVDATATDIVCVGAGELRRTSKLTLGVALGKPIVTDRWVEDSVRARRLLALAPYVPRDAEREARWRFSLRDAIERGRQGVRAFAGWTVCLSPTLTQEAKDTAAELERMAKSAGAAAVVPQLPKEPPPPPSSSSSSSSSSLRRTIIIGAERDPLAPAMAELGWRMFSKDIVSLSILRGRIDVGGDGGDGIGSAGDKGSNADEFRIDPASCRRAAAGRGRRKQ